MGQATSHTPQKTEFHFSQKKIKQAWGFFPQFSELNQLTKGSRAPEPIQGALEHGEPCNQQAAAPEVKPFPDSSDLVDVLCQCHEITPPFVS